MTRTSPRCKVGPIAGPVVDPELGHAFSDRLYVPEISKFEPREASRDLGRSPAITKLLEPLLKSVGLANLDHVSTIGDRKSSTSRGCRL